VVILFSKGYQEPVSNVNYFVRSASIILAGFSHIDN
jgi:hypothetical protein